MDAAWAPGGARPSFPTQALLGIILLGAYAFFLYGDVRATFEHSISFLDSGARAELRDYQIAISTPRPVTPAVYDIPLYLLFRAVEPADLHHLPDHRLPLPAVDAGATVAPRP